MLYTWNDSAWIPFCDFFAPYYVCEIYWCFYVYLQFLILTGTYYSIVWISHNLSILLIDIYVVFSFWYLWTVLLWAFVYIYFNLVYRSTCITRVLFFTLRFFCILFKRSFSTAQLQRDSIFFSKSCIVLIFTCRSSVHLGLKCGVRKTFNSPLHPQEWLAKSVLFYFFKIVSGCDPLSLFHAPLIITYLAVWKPTLGFPNHFLSAHWNWL